MVTCTELLGERHLVTEQNEKLNQLFGAKQAEMMAVLHGVKSTVGHSTMKGIATEEGWRTLLEHYLPERYRIDTGKLIDSSGAESDQIDLIILDRQYSPLIFDSGGQKYFPAESVYGVFEIKQDLDKENIEYASGKVASVRALRRTSAAVVHAGGEFEPRNPFSILGGILTTSSGWNPPFGMPFETSLAELRNHEQIDLGCALSDGAFRVDRSSGASPTIKLHKSERSLVGFVFDLMTELQRLGTVSAIDYGEYLD